MELCVFLGGNNTSIQKNGASLWGPDTTGEWERNEFTLRQKSQATCTQFQDPIPQADFRMQPCDRVICYTC